MYGKICMEGTRHSDNAIVSEFRRQTIVAPRMTFHQISSDQETEIVSISI